MRAKSLMRRKESAKAVKTVWTREGAPKELINGDKGNVFRRWFGSNDPRTPGHTPATTRCLFDSEKRSGAILLTGDLY